MSELAESSVWPASWKLACSRTAQYSQLVLFDSELEVCCHALGVTHREGGIMLALPELSMD